MTKIEHIALASNSEEESDRFFIELLGLEQIRNFSVSEELMEKFFEIKKEQQIIRYSNENLDIEVFITKDDSKSSDNFTHVCLVIQDRDKFVEKAKEMGEDERDDTKKEIQDLTKQYEDEASKLAKAKEADVMEDA